MDQKLLECPICMVTYQGKIYLCDGGHSLCEKCTNLIETCPKCSKPMTTKRSFDLEALVEGIRNNVKVPCSNNGCPYLLTPDKHTAHQIDCKYRMHLCHGATFNNFNCKWLGKYNDLLNHFKTAHPDHSRLPACTKTVMLHCNFENFKDIQMLSFLDGKQLFYYKHKVDKKKQKLYWVFQFVGPNKEANNYTYEFEINKDQLKYKINGICMGDTEDCEEYFESENCIVLSFKQMKHYLNSKNEVNIRFRIGNINHLNSEKPENKFVNKFKGAKPHK